MKRFLTIAVIVLIAGALFISCQAMGIDGENMDVETLVKETFGQGSDGKDGPLTASGTIRADEIRVATELGGRIVKINVAKGDQIQAGDVLVELDATQLLDKLAEAQAAVVAAQADLAVVLAGARPQEISAAQAILSLAAAQRDGAWSTWQHALTTVQNPQEIDAQITEAQTQINLAEQGTILAQAQLEREKLLRDQKPKNSTARQIADLQVQAAEKALATAQADLETAQTLLYWLQLVRNKPLGLIVQANVAEGQYTIAEQGVVVAQAKLDDLLAGATAEEITVAERAVALAQAQVRVLEANLSKFTLTSPADGVVVNQVLHSGELAARAATILTISDLSQVTLVVYVPENRVGEVQLGQQVQVTVDSFAGQVFVGHVSHIGDQPQFTPRNVATKEERQNTFYAVEIELDNAKGLLKPGMPADATF